MSLLTAPIVKNNHILAGIYFIILIKPHRPKLKVVKYQIWSSVKKSEKWLYTKFNNLFAT